MVGTVVAEDGVDDVDADAALLVDTVGLKVTVRCRLGGAGGVVLFLEVEEMRGLVSLEDAMTDARYSYKYSSKQS